ncbi:hypothetical protein THAOC_20151, partial [Thalassiosira oceanica]
LPADAAQPARAATPWELVPKDKRRRGPGGGGRPSEAERRRDTRPGERGAGRRATAAGSERCDPRPVPSPPGGACPRADVVLSPGSRRPPAPGTVLTSSPPRVVGSLRGPSRGVGQSPPSHARRTPVVLPGFSGFLGSDRARGEGFRTGVARKKGASREMPGGLVRGTGSALYSQAPGKILERNPRGDGSPPRIGGHGRTELGEAVPEHRSGPGRLSAKGQSPGRGSCANATIAINRSKSGQRLFD